MHFPVLVPGYIKATQCKKKKRRKQDIKNILSEKVGGI